VDSCFIAEACAPMRGRTEAAGSTGVRAPAPAGFSLPGMYTAYVSEKHIACRIKPAGKHFLQ